MNFFQLSPNLNRHIIIVQLMVGVVDRCLGGDIRFCFAHNYKYNTRR